MFGVSWLVKTIMVLRRQYMLPCTAGESLCRKTGLSRTTVFGTLNQLKDFGFVEKYDKKFYIIHIDKITDVRYATQAELDKRKEKQKPVDKAKPDVQQSSHQQGFIIQTTMMKNLIRHFRGNNHGNTLQHHTR